jgi:glycosyltransferase involved in cell wall biosynthesis
MDLSENMQGVSSVIAVGAPGRASADKQAVSESPAVSVVLCTHNPRLDYLRRTVAGLRAQTLPPKEWELVVVDNASEPSLAAGINNDDPNLTAPPLDLSWHPSARIVREESVGLTRARLKGIAEASARILVFVDDDNVLDCDYLQKCVEVAAEFPMIGAWGGTCRGEFEQAVPDWVRPYLGGLAVHEIEHDCWSDTKGWSPGSPYGAGLCLRRNVADEFVRCLSIDPALMRLDRQGDQLLSGGDTLMADCAVDCGMKTARLARLRLTHLIPPDRLTEDYIVRLYAGFEISKPAVAGAAPQTKVKLIEKLRDQLRFARRWWSSPPIQRKVMREVRRLQAKLPPP